MEILIGQRQTGKTTELMEWVDQGVRCDGYPGWTRVAVVPTMDRLLQVKAIWWETMEDFDHRVYYLDELSRNFTSSETCYRFDDMDFVIQRLLPNIKITGFTITGQGWND